jgi:RNA recognition motif-containing protein
VSSKRVFLSSLPYEANEDEVCDLVQQFADVSLVKLCVDYATGRSRGFCFIDAKDDAGVQALISGLHNYRWGKRSLRAELARPRPSGDEARSLYS